MTHEERMALVKASQERYRAAMGEERERFTREFHASTQRRMELERIHSAELADIATRYAATNGLEVTA